jgi:membrane associated rhomboid family serine protease
VLIPFLPIPYGTDRVRRGVPYVTFTLIGLNVLVYAWMTWRFLRDPSSLYPFWLLSVTPGDFRWYTLLTHLFAHDAPLPLHVGFNMLFLWVFGSHVEDALGRGMFAVLYFAGGLAAATVHTVVSTQSAVVETGSMYLGASGAIAAVMGLFAVRFYRTRILVWYVTWLLVFLRTGTFAVSSVVGLALWLSRDLFWGVYNLFEPIPGGVAHWAHIGGFVFGVLAAYALGMRSEGGKEYSLEDAWATFRGGAARVRGAAVRGARRAAPRRPRRAVGPRRVLRPPTGPGTSGGSV